MNYTALARNITLTTFGVILAAGFATPALAASKASVPERLHVSKVLQDITGSIASDKKSAKQKNADSSIISDAAPVADASGESAASNDSGKQSVTTDGGNASADQAPIAPVSTTQTAAATSSELAIATPIAAPALTSENATPPSSPARAAAPTPASISAAVTKATTNTLASLFTGKAIDESSGSPYADTLSLSFMQTMYLLALALALTGVALGEPEFLAVAYAAAAETLRTGRFTISQSGVRA